MRHKSARRQGARESYIFKHPYRQKVDRADSQNLHHGRISLVQSSCITASPCFSLRCAALRWVAAVSTTFYQFYPVF
jgi:hypothetical protein